MKKLNSWNKFIAHTGLLETKDQVKDTISDPIFKRLSKSLASESPYGWSADRETLKLLNKVCEKNPNLYIATQVENDNGNGVTYENETRYVNRNVYYLCTKNKENLVYFSERF